MLREANEENGIALSQQALAQAAYDETGARNDADALGTAKDEVAKAKAYLTHAKNTRNANRIKSMIELSKPSLVIKADKLDANPFDLNTPLGSWTWLLGGFDLTSGQPIAVGSHRPDQTIEAWGYGMTSSTPSLVGTGAYRAFSSLWLVCH